MADGWRCPSCFLVLAPSVASHRCDPPASGVTTVPPRPWQPGSVGISTPNVSVTWPDTWTVTTGTSGPAITRGAWLAAVPDTDGMPPRQITEDAA